MPAIASLTKTLPASWYTREEQFELEQRAIFSKTWHLATHRSRFHKPGDYIAFEMANLPYFLSLDKEGQIKGFHNLCRHRASPLLQKAVGSQTVVGCAYQ
jgi:phenylpropionate dioxygenase-like ring-hydroxylating dioxygenase large terminal subunit